MTIKAKFNALNTGKLDDTSSSSSSISKEAESEAAKAAMVYLKSVKSLDLRKMKAADYKFNKHILIPKNKSAKREVLHEMRRHHL